LKQVAFLVILKPPMLTDTVVMWVAFSVTHH